jgi:putative transposase
MRIKTVYCVPKTTQVDKASYKYPYLLKGIEIDRPNQVWAVDITYIPMKRGFMYMVAIIDLHSRFIVGRSLSNTMEASWVIATILEAIQRYGAPEIINSDQGSQFTSAEYVSFCQENNIKISMDGKGRALDNVYIERFWRTIKHEKLYLWPTDDTVELLEQINSFINYYNHRRVHSSLSYNTPGAVYGKAA